MSLNRCVLAVLDPTTDDQPAARKGAVLARSLGVRLELFVARYDQFVDTNDKARNGLLKRTAEKFQSLHEELSADLDVRLDVRWDRPVDEAVVRKVEEVKPGIVVKDTHYHPAIKRAIFSNTDWNLIRTCPVPLLLAKAAPLSARPRIVAAVDPVCAHDKPARLDRRILGVSRALGAALNGELTVVHAFDDAAVSAAIHAAAGAGMGAAAPLMQSPEILETEEKKRRDAFEALLREESIDLSQSRLLTGNPVDELIRCAEDMSAEIMVTGAVSRSGLKRLLIGQTAEALLDRVPCDLLVVKLDEQVS